MEIALKKGLTDGRVKRDEIPQGFSGKTVLTFPWRKQILNCNRAQNSELKWDVDTKLSWKFTGKFRLCCLDRSGMIQEKYMCRQIEIKTSQNFDGLTFVVHFRCETSLMFSEIKFLNELEIFPKKTYGFSLKLLFLQPNINSLDNFPEISDWKSFSAREKPFPVFRWNRAREKKPQNHAATSIEHENLPNRFVILLDLVFVR